MAGLTLAALRKLTSDARVTAATTSEQVCFSVMMQDTTPLGWELASVRTPEGWTNHSYAETATGAMIHRQPGIEPPPGTKTYCDFLVAKGDGACVGKANRFVSHAWMLMFLEVLAAIEAGLLQHGSLVRLAETQQLGMIVRYDASDDTYVVQLPGAAAGSGAGTYICTAQADGVAIRTSPDIAARDDRNTGSLKGQLVRVSEVVESSTGDGIHFIKRADAPEGRSWFYPITAPGDDDIMFAPVVRVSAKGLEPMHDETTEIFLWFDIATINEHEPEKVSKGFSTTFMEAVGAIGHVLLVMTPWTQPVVLSRSWCLWEVFCTWQQKCKLTICLPQAERSSSFARQLGDPHLLTDTLATIDSSNAKAGAEKDRLKIAKAIEESVGFKALDAMIFSKVRDWALEVSKDALAEARRTVGEDKLGGAGLGAAFGLANQLQTQGRDEEALAQWKRVIWEFSLEGSHGPNHRETLKARANYATTLKDARGSHLPSVDPEDKQRSRLELAEEEFEEVIKLQTLHRESALATKTNLAGCLSQMGAQDPTKYTRAEELFQEIRAIENSATLMQNHGSLLKNMGRLDEASVLLRKSIADSKPNGVVALITKRELAAVLGQQGDVAGAVEMAADALRGLAALLGPDHVHAQFAQSNLDGFRLSMKHSALQKRNSESIWGFQMVDDDRIIFINTSTGMTSLDAPADGVNQQYGRNPAAEGEYARLLEMRRMADAGLVNPASPWIKYENEAATTLIYVFRNRSRPEPAVSRTDEPEDGFHQIVTHNHKLVPETRLERAARCSCDVCEQDPIAFYCPTCEADGAAESFDLCAVCGAESASQAKL